LFEKQMEIFQRIREWRVENEQLGLIPDFTDTWTPKQRETFMYNWQNDEPFIQVNEGDERFYEAMNDESLIQQVGRGQKRSSEEMSGDDEVSGNFFTVNGIKQVNVKSLRPRVRITLFSLRTRFPIWNFLSFMTVSTKYFKVCLIELPMTFPRMIRSVLYYIPLSLSIQYRYLLCRVNVLPPNVC
jgi:hypothetical protein